MKKAENHASEASKRHKAALFFMVSSTVGIGYMGYPKLCETVGAVNLIIVSTLTGLVSLFYSALILRAYLLRKSETYADLVREVLGQFHYYTILAYILASLLFSTTAQIAVISQLAREVLPPRALANLPCPEAINAGFGVLAVLLSFSKLYKIRPLSYIGNAFSLATGLVLVAQAAERLYRTGASADMKLAGFNRGLVKVVNNCLFSYTSQITMVSIVRVLKDDSNYLHYSALLRAHYLAFFLYSLVGVSGYALLGAQTPDTIFVKPRGPGVLGSMFVVGRLGLFLSLSVTLCLKVLSIQHMGWSLYAAVVGRAAEQRPGPRVVRPLISVVAGCIVIAGSIVASKNILASIQVVCGLLLPYIIFICPTLLAWKLRAEMGLGPWRLAALTAATGLFTLLLLCSCFL